MRLGFLILFVLFGFSGRAKAVDWEETAEGVLPAAEAAETPAWIAEHMKHLAENMGSLPQIPKLNQKIHLPEIPAEDSNEKENQNDHQTS
ncbi:MAG: hypothetical protein HYZ85_04810 [Candidatus Omnitrophica bacterium]|nr:hypothetical protein [Candidatus Omnitrophota bacterium]